MIFIICATDAGGIRNTVPLIAACSKRNINTIVITTEQGSRLFGQAINQASQVLIADQPSLSLLDNVLDQFAPAAAICGTTRFAAPDRDIIPLARSKGIPTVVILDEWYNYGMRFEDINSKEMAYLSDAVAVQDELARQEAISEGIPAEKCHITGSPSLAELTRKARSLMHTPPTMPNILSHTTRPVIVFLSETHAADYGTIITSPGPLGPYIGYTEDIVREDLLTKIGELEVKVLLVEKIHPSITHTSHPGYIPDNIEFLTIGHIDLWQLLWHSDFVVGMRSMALLESRILGATAISYQPGLIGPEQCTAVRLGLIDKLEHPGELGEWLAEQLNKRAGRKLNKTVNTYPFAAEKAADNVIQLALSKEINQ